MIDVTWTAQPGGVADQINPMSIASDPASTNRLLDLVRDTIEATFAKVLSEVRLEASQTGSPRSSTKTGFELRPSDMAKAADLRVAFLVGKIPENTGLLIDSKVLSKLLDTSHSTLYRLLAEEALPAPVQFGRLKKWRLAEIIEWIEADCPPQKVWVHLNWSKRKGR
jgi:predicted DNA-binding transcriptional regulator AlpA